MVDQDNPLSFGNHAGYIANCSRFDNERPPMKKGPTCGPLMRLCIGSRYSCAASAPSGPLAPCASEIRAFLPRSPRR